jgi:hypothetical protein
MIPHASFFLCFRSDVDEVSVLASLGIALPTFRYNLVVSSSSNKELCLLFASRHGIVSLKDSNFHPHPQSRNDIEFVSCNLQVKDADLSVGNVWQNYVKTRRRFVVPFQQPFKKVQKVR